MKVGVPYLGVLVIRSLLFRLLYWVPPFSGSSSKESSSTEGPASSVATRISDPWILLHAS